MANHTKSGLIAVGAPLSRARFLGEAEAAMEHPMILLLTDEGNALADRFFRSVGCEPAEMTPESRAEILRRHAHSALFHFLAGAVFALRLP